MTITEEDINRIVDERIKTYSEQHSQIVKPKKERKKSNWQIYLKECIPNQEKNKSLGEKVKACSIEYQSKKAIINNNSDNNIVDTNIQS